MEEIILEGLNVNARIGCYPEEQESTQNLIIDLILRGDLRKACESDNLHDSIDYVDIIGATRKFSSTFQGKTLEYYAHTLALHLKSLYSLNEIDIKVEKPKYATDLNLDRISIHVIR